MHPFCTKQIRNLAQLIIGLAVLCFAQTAIGHTQQPPTQWLYDRALASTCVQCHAKPQQSSKQPNIPSLDGYNKAMIVEQMQAFKNGTRPATIMHQIAKGYSDADIERIAEILSTGLWHETKPAAAHSTPQPK